MLKLARARQAAEPERARLVLEAERTHSARVPIVAQRHLRLNGPRPRPGQDSIGDQSLVDHIE